MPPSLPIVLASLTLLENNGMPYFVKYKVEKTIPSDKEKKM
jgi:hypothetical protein